MNVGGAANNGGTSRQVKEAFAVKRTRNSIEITTIKFLERRNLKMGNSSRKENKKRKTNEASHYWQAAVEFEGDWYQVLLTDSEVKRAIKRATNNPEDVESCKCGRKKECKTQLICSLFGF